MGGSTDVDTVFTWMADQGGNGDFLVLRGSGSDGYQEYIDDIAEVNSVSTIVIKDAEAARDPFVLDRVQKAEAVFFAGGDQWNYVGKWKGTPLLDELNKSLARGVPMGGTSAGLAILGQHVFTAEKSTISSEEALQDPYHSAITLESDFLKTPLLENLITDSHFSERDRMGRLVTFMARLQADRGSAQMKGVGVDEKTAVIVSPDGQGVVVGQGKAHFVKADKKPEVVQPGEPLTHGSLEVHSVSPSESFHLGEWKSQDVRPKNLKVVKGMLGEES
jgi:cyanophycinase